MAFVITAIKEGHYVFFDGVCINSSCKAFDCWRTWRHDRRIRSLKDGFNSLYYLKLNSYTWLNLSSYEDIFSLFSSGMEGGRKETVLSSVQEMWEKSFREIGEDNPEHTVTGIIIFYPTYLIAYCEVRILRGFFVSILNRYQ